MEVASNLFSIALPASERSHEVCLKISAAKVRATGWKAASRKTAANFMGR